LTHDGPRAGRNVTQLDTTLVRKRIVYRRRLRSGSLLTNRAVDRFAEEVCMAGVASGLLDEVQEHPPQREVPPVAQRPD